MGYRGETAAARAIAIELATSVALSHPWVVANLKLTIDARRDMSGIPSELVATAERLGLRYLGRGREEVAGRAFESAIFADPSSRAYVALRTGQSGTSRYVVVSVFEDRTTILSLARTVSPLRSSARVMVRLGTEDLERDLASHLAAVDERVGSMVLPVEDGEDFLRALTIYYRHSISTEVVDAMKLRARSRLPTFVGAFVGRFDYWLASGTPFGSSTWWPILAVATWAAASALAYVLSGPMLALLTAVLGIPSLAIGMLGKHDAFPGSLQLRLVTWLMVWAPSPTTPLSFRWILGVNLPIFVVAMMLICTGPGNAPARAIQLGWAGLTMCGWYVSMARLWEQRRQTLTS